MRVEDSPAENIVCPTTKWYFRRMAQLFLMVTAISCWFLYDAVIGYPKKIAIYQEFKAFDERKESYERMEAEGRLDEWGRIAGEKGWPAEKPGFWRDYAAPKGWPEKPDKYEPGKEKEQYYWSGAMGVVALLILACYFLNRRKVLVADAESFTTPRGVVVKFDDVFQVDKRKWKHKGLAYVSYRPGGGGAKKAVIDDLKFDGAQAILDRVLDNFEGELIDRIEEDDEGATEPVEDGAAEGKKS